MASTSKTDLFCRTWVVTADNDPESIGGKVIFSKAGTYFVYYIDGELGISSWKWKDEASGWLFYSWDNPPVWTEECQVQILELTTNKLKIYETIEGKEYITELEPSSIN